MIDEIHLSTTTPEGWICEFKEILKWFERVDHPGDELEPPVYYQTLTNERICKDVLKRFDGLSAVPITIKDNQLLIPNDPVAVKRTEYGESDEWTIQYDVPTTAILWSIRPAGMFILTRPAESPVKYFLEQAMGVGKEAGRKIIEMETTIQSYFPGTTWDYDRAGIYEAIEEQKYWIKTAALSELISGRLQIYDSYAGVLTSIGEDPLLMNFYSANKAAVLLYAITERLERINGMDSCIKSAEVMDVLPFNEVIQATRCFALTVANIGMETEKTLDKAKKNRHLSKRADVYYQRKGEIFQVQSAKIQEVFDANPSHEATLVNLQKYAELVGNLGLISPVVMDCVVQTIRFCLGHMQLKAKMSAEPVSWGNPGQEGFRQGGSLPVLGVAPIP